ncbi:hypothetical protein [Rheinheimera soli]|uniref:DNA repair exonuclease SbcCD ATPase subunit n=1 Tax=Rheinheimera soli TaxID=443616 RepID=A0ABU1VU93_9GAMM|nr:hypothetical protein [Rheinheimera soli]MDR7119294.1 DNA repair exonuclease SbcCD ATPase subunit [Rheinheimera soli]
MDDIASVLQLEPKIELVAAYESAEIMLTRLQNEGMSVDQAVNYWQKNTETLLLLQQQHRRSLKLFNISALSDDTTVFPEWLSVSFKKGNETVSHTIFTVIAAQAMRQNKHLKALQQRLFASSLPLTEQMEPQFDLEHIKQQLCQNDELENACSERDLALMRLKDAQEELAQNVEVKQLYNSLKEDYQRDVQLLQGKLKDGENKINSATKQLGLFQEEFDRITAAQHSNHDELEKVRVERDSLFLQVQKGVEALKKQDRSSAELQDKHQKLQNDYTSKIQQEIPQLNKTIGQVKDRLKQAEEESHQLLLQLQQVQEELENKNRSYADLYQMHQTLQNDYTETVQHEVPQLIKTIDETKLRLKQVEEKNHRLMLQQQQELESYRLKLQIEQQKNNRATTARDKQQQRELSKLESQLRRTKARASSAEHNVYLLQQELNAVKGSVLWKSGTPVRVLRRMVTKTDKEKQKLQQETALILTSEYFDLEWYLETYPDVAQSNINPAEHYLKFGAAEGRMPGPLFDGNWYLQRYSDVASVNINPLLHFVKFGQQEGRSASPKLLTDNSQEKEE